MDAWGGWDFQRFYLLFVAAAFVLLGLQVFLFHWRAAFSRPTMYLPVAAAPLLALVSAASETVEASESPRSTRNSSSASAPAGVRKSPVATKSDTQW